MSYHNQIQRAILDPKGIDKVIEDICLSLSDVEWLSNIYRRAWLINNSVGANGLFTPMVYLQQMEYYNVLPNDNFSALSFIAVTSPERPINQTDVNTVGWEAQKERDIALVVWCNLEKIDNSMGYPFTEVLKNELEPLLGKVEGLTINSYVDEDYRQIFSGYDISETDNKFFAYPYAAFRFNCTAGYGGKYRSC